VLVLRVNLSDVISKFRTVVMFVDIDLESIFHAQFEDKPVFGRVPNFTTQGLAFFRYNTTPQVKKIFPRPLIYFISYTTLP